MQNYTILGVVEKCASIYDKWKIFQIRIHWFKNLLFSKVSI